tara:strand:+ start:2085 stop:2999 length:915 start_codon:yes stop_codon:yes gene_type:complete
MVDFVFYENCKICDTKGKKIYSENYSDKNFVNFFSNFYGHINYNLLLDYVKHEKFELYKCEDCNFIWQRVEPDGEFSFLLYEEIIDKKVSYQKSIDIIQKRKQRFKTEFELIYNYFNVKKLNILDFGAGWGTWLDVIDRNKANLYAFEISPSRKTHLIKNGFTVLDENTIKNYDNFFHFIRLEQVLEHLTDLQDNIQLIKKISLNGGLINVGVPNGSSEIKNNTSYKIEKGPVQPLEHVNCFNNKSLIKFFRLNGFENLSFLNLIINHFKNKPTNKEKIKYFISDIIKNLFSTSVRFINKKNKV